MKLGKYLHFIAIHQKLKTENTSKTNCNNFTERLKY